MYNHQNGFENQLLYRDYYRFPTPGNSIAPPPHPQDYGLRVQPELSKSSRLFQTSLHPPEPDNGPYYRSTPIPQLQQSQQLLQPQSQQLLQPQPQPQYIKSQPQYQQQNVPPQRQPPQYQSQVRFEEPANHVNNQRPQRPRRKRPTNETRSFGRGVKVNYQYSECTGRKKALCIGINYVGTENELGGCQNDADKIRRFLIKRCGYKPQNIMLLKDSSEMGQNMQPTKRNLFRAMDWLVQGAKLNDALFFHYSGHGGRTKDLSGDEIDGFDETIFPVDFQKAGHIIDDTMHEKLVQPLPAGCRLTALFDSCHSGTALDLPFMYDSNGEVKEPDVLKMAAGELFSHKLPNGMILPLHDIYYFSKKLLTGRSEDKKRKKTKFSPADVIMFAASKDSETAADAGQSGAMSYAFLSILYKNRDDDLSFIDLLNTIRDHMRGTYSQRPQLSSSHELDMDLAFVC
ncbi:Metacaspase-1 [Wallemia ichthyophaga EXF-994]|uniref:Metacaspase-1 n=1 Tax=Wallemia ichthyophaga (strain EXF-994 / CBS 113033) TaxID=1299270 RepID=R9ATV4_WALI9|nr:Metacaspase-1 [Wallemia ichthyophaga EXF-994]EOR03511.1 Metacaspase-1 [Wallemia ichthyophaga EXF-994]